MSAETVLVLLLSIVILKANPVDCSDEKYFSAVCKSDVHPLVGVYNLTKHDTFNCARVCLEGKACNYFATRKQTGGQIDDCVLGFGKTTCDWNTATSAKWKTYMKSGPVQVCNCSSNMIPFGNSCYTFPSGTFTWDDGFAHCASLNASMIEIGDMAENGFLVLEGKSRGFSRIWLGGTDKDIEMTFVWNSGAPVTITNNWGPGEPKDVGGEDYVELQMSNSKWNDHVKTALKYMACEASCL